MPTKLVFVNLSTRWSHWSSLDSLNYFENLMYLNVDRYTMLCSIVSVVSIIYRIYLPINSTYIFPIQSPLKVNESLSTSEEEDEIYEDNKQTSIDLSEKLNLSESGQYTSRLDSYLGGTVSRKTSIFLASHDGRDESKDGDNCSQATDHSAYEKERSNEMDVEQKVTCRVVPIYLCLESSYNAYIPSDLKYSVHSQKLSAF